MFEKLREWGRAVELLRCLMLLGVARSCNNHVLLFSVDGVCLESDCTSVVSPSSLVLCHVLCDDDSLSVGANGCGGVSRGGVGLQVE